MSPTHERAARIRYRRALALLGMTLVIPGSAQLVAGNRRVGRVAMRTWIALMVLGLVSVVLVLIDRSLIFWMVSSPNFLLVSRLALIALALGWAYLIVDAWRLGQPLTLTMPHRRAVVGLNGAVCFSIAAVLLFGSHLVGVQRDFIIATFGDGDVSGANDGRFNVLLLGGDSGAGRWGMRPDSITVASIDAETGKTVLIGLPRNLANFPFKPDSTMDKQFPNGFDCDGCYINGVSTWAQDHPELYPEGLDPGQIGARATTSAVEGVTGLEINYWAMVNLEGFRSLVDAVGGVELTVREPIPVGGLGSDVTGYIEPGTRKLNGHDTLWYARAREGSDDYSRMARQKCVMNAMLNQVSPQTAVRNFEDIASASSAMISTSLPASELDRFIELSLKAKSQKMATLSLVPPMINTAEPDIDVVHAKVDEAIDKAEGDGPEKAAESGTRKPKKAAPEAGVTGGSVGSLSEGYQANATEDLGAAC